MIFLKLIITCIDTNQSRHQSKDNWGFCWDIVNTIVMANFPFVWQKICKTTLPRDQLQNIILPYVACILCSLLCLQSTRSLRVLPTYPCCTIDLSPFWSSPCKHLQHQSQFCTCPSKAEPTPEEENINLQYFCNLTWPNVIRCFFY